MKKDKVIVLGFFDGVHLAHQKLITLAKTRADELGLPLMVHTYDLSPKMVRSGVHNETLLSPEKKIEIFKCLGANEIYVEHFDENFAHKTPQEFIEYIEGFHPHTVVVGYDYTFGCNKSGKAQDLKGDFETIIMPKETLHDTKISSSEIRNLIAKGELDKVEEYLGTRYEITGEVVHGRALGRTIGFPTANVEADYECMVPDDGVYATLIKVKDKKYPSMTSVGTNETVSDSNKRTIETNIFNFDEDIYGETVTVEFIKKIRDMVKFSSLDELKNQIETDREEIKRDFDLHPHPVL
ncbi:MAG: bifunctional riboflavin kinase/FAD synthetase [Lactobacillales bacterium]|jgi:riboflavin kinase/FMN adenylyltransferase|nr:bifunctional riboflavin kinase/FAD synthetase [Lactobacillales bacterium]